jgi:Cdc6-like AAA superfamily ATPase
MPQKPNFEAIDFKLGRIFTPTTPINSDDLFRGRKDQVRAVVDAINQVGRHAILYGERGVGKTSLGQILKTKLTARQPMRIIAPLINCDSGDGYMSIWSKVFSEMDPDGGSDDVGNDEDGGVTVFTPHKVRKKIEEAAEDVILYVILDEFDKITNQTARSLIADTIKLFSDRAVDATLIIIGVADDVTGLIQDHQSIERCLAQIHMPRMPREELEEIVKHGLAKVGMKIDTFALGEITALSKGLPHYTHLLALHASRQALDEKQTTVSPAHAKQAIRAAIREAQESIRSGYDKATYSSRKGTLHSLILLGCAIADTDEFGRFQPIDVCEPLSGITGDSYGTDRFASHLKAFCDEDRGAVLERMGIEYRWRYRFSNPLMQPYVIMKGIESGQITDEKLRHIVEHEQRYPLFKKGQNP